MIEWRQRRTTAHARQDDISRSIYTCIHIMKLYVLTVLSENNHILPT